MVGRRWRMNPSGIIWAGLQVMDLDRETDYFRDVVGLRLIRKTGDWAVFDAGGGVLFELSAGGAQSMHPKTGEQQSLVVGFRVDDLSQTVRVLRERGVSFITELEAYKSSRWIKFVDPEGNILELKEIA
jgi:predicted enzyme related to lactoylglutathione lyase